MQSDPSVGPSNEGWQHPQQLSLFAALTMIGQAALLASAWLLPFVSEYDLIGDNISELVLGRFGFIQTIAFVLAGLGTLALAYALWWLTPAKFGPRTATLLVTVYGLGAILSAIFPTDRIDSPADLWNQSTTGMIHIAIALVSFPAIILAMFILAWTLRRVTQWGSFSIWTALLAVAALALFLMQGEGPRVGLMQRAMVTAISIWQILTALWLPMVADSYFTARQEIWRSIREKAPEEAWRT
jgi:hypothetical protein